MHFNLCKPLLAQLHKIWINADSYFSLLGSLCENKAPFGATNYYHEYAHQQRMGFSASNS
ncbi:MAG: hypothetical protein ACI9OH_002301 [Oleispira sp.]|jgi:hypothetical protein